MKLLLKVFCSAILEDYDFPRHQKIGPCCLEGEVVSFNHCDGNCSRAGDRLIFSSVSTIDAESVAKCPSSYHLPSVEWNGSFVANFDSQTSLPDLSLVGSTVVLNATE